MNSPGHRRRGAGPGARRGAVVVALLLGLRGLGAAEEPGADGPAERRYQVAVLLRLAKPVLQAGSEGALAERLPHFAAKRDRYAPLEALGRTLAGIAPWLELGPEPGAEGELRAHSTALAVEAIRRAVAPEGATPRALTPGGQPLVDLAFLAQALLRAPHQLWGNLDETARGQLVALLKQSRAIRPPQSNWLLFSAMVEAALLEFTGEGELRPIEEAVERHLAWYAGDGAYGDGPPFHWDYYNSFVIHPMLLEILEVCARKNLPPGRSLEVERGRAQRYAQVLERMISPEGTFPLVGRSATYRFGALHALSLLALRHELPKGTTPAGVRSALQAVIHRMAEAPGTFDAAGWLQVGMVGAQPRAAEAYISAGSGYLCTLGLLQLGLPASDPFWQGPDEPWTQKRLWAGEDLPADHALEDRR